MRFIYLCVIFMIFIKKFEKDKNFKNIELSCFRHQMRMVEILVKMAVEQT